jgi:hypothetical protein
MDAKYSIATRRVTADRQETIGVLVLGKSLVFIAVDERTWNLYGRRIEAAAANAKGNGVTLEEIFTYYADRDLGPAESWSTPASRRGSSEREIGEAVLSEAEFVARSE